MLVCWPGGCGCPAAQRARPPPHLPASPACPTQGQHMVGAGGLAWDEELQRVLAEANRSPAMKAVYLRYLAAWRQRTGQPLMHFVHCGRWSPWGLWGAQEYPSQPRGAAPKLDALLEFAATAPLDPA